MGFSYASLKIGTEVIRPIRYTPTTYANLFAMQKALIDLNDFIKLKDCKIITLPILKIIKILNIRCAILESGATHKISIRLDPECSAKLLWLNHLKCSFVLYSHSMPQISKGCNQYCASSQSGTRAIDFWCRWIIISVTSKEGSRVALLKKDRHSPCDEILLRNKN